MVFNVSRGFKVVFKKNIFVNKTMQCAYEFVKPKIKVKTITNNGGRKDTLTGNR